ncbi:MAG: hypothetical protein KatS3mg001_035 [Candidatus Pacearchaeota archaeon]|nr:MAG: hypothetical protein KatS3mg001_035 [Candidatus Pacearchaeota archaeon]
MITPLPLKRTQYGLENPNSSRDVFEGEVDPERYEILERYKVGAHSIIYKALDTKTKRIVAIKKHLHYIPQTNNPEEIRLD